MRSTHHRGAGGAGVPWYLYRYPGYPWRLDDVIEVSWQSGDDWGIEYFDRDAVAEASATGYCGA